MGKLNQLAWALLLVAGVSVSSPSIANDTLPTSWESPKTSLVTAETREKLKNLGWLTWESGKTVYRVKKWMQSCLDWKKPEWIDDCNKSIMDEIEMKWLEYRVQAESQISEYESIIIKQQEVGNDYFESLMNILSVIHVVSWNFISGEERIGAAMVQNKKWISPQLLDLIRKNPELSQLTWAGNGGTWELDVYALFWRILQKDVVSYEPDGKVLLTILETCIQEYFNHIDNYLKTRRAYVVFKTQYNELYWSSERVTQQESDFEATERRWMTALKEAVELARLMLQWTWVNSGPKQQKVASM